MSHPLSDKAPTREEFLALEDEFLDLEGDDSDAALDRRAAIKAKLKRWGPHAACGKEPMIEMVVPRPVGSKPDQVNGDYFKINGKTFVGKIVVPACTARQLHFMIDRNRRVDQERFRGQTQTFTGLELNARVLPAAE